MPVAEAIKFFTGIFVTQLKHIVWLCIVARDVVADRKESNAKKVQIWI
jgi:hypothetical protein